MQSFYLKPKTTSVFSSQRSFIHGTVDHKNWQYCKKGNKLLIFQISPVYICFTIYQTVFHSSLIEKHTQTRKLKAICGLTRVENRLSISKVPKLWWFFFFKVWYPQIPYSDFDIFSQAADNFILFSDKKDNFWKVSKLKKKRIHNFRNKKKEICQLCEI